MAYVRQEFKNDETVLTAEHLNHIEDGIFRVYDDLYDSKSINTYEKAYTTTENFSKPSWTTQFITSTFNGWYACVGKPLSFNRIKFLIAARADMPINSIRIAFYEVPNLDEITLNTEEKNVAKAYTPVIKDWNRIAFKEVWLDEPITSTTYVPVTIDFDRTITSSRYLYAYIGSADATYVSMGIFKNTYNDIPFDPYYAYSNGNTNDNCAYVTNNSYDYTSKNVVCHAMEFYTVTESVPYIELGTKKKDKFFELVNECMNNSESLGSVFEEKYTPYYNGIGSQDLLKTKSTKIADPGSTFTGVVFACGVVPSDKEIHGAAFQISARTYNGDSSPATECYAYLYEVDKIPYGVSSKFNWNDLNPVLVRSGKAEINCPVDETMIVNVRFSGEPYFNTGNKFLMLGYNLNTYFKRIYNSNSIMEPDLCSMIDGNTYTENLSSYYATQKTINPTWQRGWLNQPANAWSFLTFEKFYDLGEDFYSRIDDAVDALDITTAPTSEVRLAQQYDLVVGDTFQLFYEGVIKSFAPLNDGITIRCKKGMQYPRYYEFTPTADDVGSYDFTLYTRRLDGTIISQGTTKIVVHPKLTNETTPKNLTLLAFGDSLTAGGKWIAEGLRRIYGTDSSIKPTSNGVTNTVTTYGRKTNTVNGFTVSHEGYGGWTWSSFLAAEMSSSVVNGIIVTLSANHNYDLNTVQKSVWVDNNGKKWELEDFPSGTQLKFNRGDGNNAAQSSTSLPTSLTCSTLSLSLSGFTATWESGNPFYDTNTQSVSLAAHAQDHGVSSPDVVACLLTWNGGGGELHFTHESKIETHITNASTLLRMIHEDFPEAKIIVCGIQLNSLTGGMGYNYGANGGYADMWGTVMYAFDYNKAIEELVTNAEFGEYCYYVDTKGQFDAYNNMPYTTKAVNTRSTVTENIGNNGVHPNDGGYYQIGDAFYRALTKVIPTITK